MREGGCVAGWAGGWVAHAACSCCCLPACLPFSLLTHLRGCQESHLPACPPRCIFLDAEGVGGARLEFLAYRIIYQAVHAGHGEILQLLNTLKKVKPEVSWLAGWLVGLRVRVVLGVWRWVGGWAG